MTSNEKVAKFNIACLIIGADRKLTEEELKQAIQFGFYKSTLTYKLYTASWYQGRRRQGQICTKHQHADIDAEYSCGMGVHLEDMELESLTAENIGLITSLWGPEGLAEVGKK
jgi:hypothetical protein